MLLYLCHADWIDGNSIRAGAGVGAGAGVDGCIDFDFGSDGDDFAVSVCVAVDFVVLVVDIVDFDFIDAHCRYLVHIC